MAWDIWTVVFIVGIILSFGAGWIFDDGGMAAAMAVCFVGSLMVAKDWK